MMMRQVRMEGVGEERCTKDGRRGVDMSTTHNQARDDEKDKARNNLYHKQQTNTHQFVHLGHPSRMPFQLEKTTKTKQNAKQH